MDCVLRCSGRRVVSSSHCSSTEGVASWWRAIAAPLRSLREIVAGQVQGLPLCERERLADTQPC